MAAQGLLGVVSVRVNAHVHRIDVRESQGVRSCSGVSDEFLNDGKCVVGVVICCLGEKGNIVA